MDNLDIEWTRLTEVLQNYADAFIKEAQNKLGQSGANASGQLAGTMKPLIEIGEEEFKISIYLQDYWFYVENNRKPGKRPPIPAIKEWIEVKGLGTGDDKKDTSWAWAIATNIGKYGAKTLPKPFFESTKEDIYKRFENDIMYAVSEDIAAYVENVLVMYARMLEGTL